MLYAYYGMDERGVTLSTSDVISKAVAEFFFVVVVFFYRILGCLTCFDSAHQPSVEGV